MYKITKLKFNSNFISKEDEIEEIEWLLTMYYRNGQVLENYLIEDHIDFYIVTVTIVDDDSLDEKYNNKYVTNQLNNLKYVSLSNIEIISDDAVASDSCHCTEYDRFYLIPSNDISSPIYCSKCEKEVPLYKLKHFYDDEYTPILDFVKTYQSLNKLWIFGLKDNYTRKEIGNPKSTFNKLGLNICNNYSKILKKDVLLGINSLIDVENECQEEVTKCLKCGQELLLNKQSKLYSKECPKCKIIYEE